MRVLKKIIVSVLILSICASMFPGWLANAAIPTDTSNYIVNTTNWDMKNLAEGVINTSVDGPNGWTISNAGGTAPKVIRVEENKILEIDGYKEIKKNLSFEGAYSFSADVKTEGTIGVFVRTGKEKFQLGKYWGHLYEADGDVGLAGSGIYIRPIGNKVKLHIKQYNESKANGIGNWTYDFDVAVDFKVGLHNITFHDDGESNIEIYVANALIAQISFSESRKVSKGTEDYYSKAVVKGATGNLIANVSNTLIAKVGCVGIGNRSSVYYLDDMKLDVYIPKPKALDERFTYSSKLNEDFEGKEGGFPNKTDKAPSGWEYRLYGGTASSVIKSGENSYLQMKGFSALKYNNLIDKPYVFSVDYTASGTTKAGIFARAGQESFRVYDGASYWTTNYHEDDRSDGDHIGSSGFYIQPLGFNFRIVLKQYIDNGVLKSISNTNVNIITDVDFRTGLHKITIVDYGDSINIYLDDNTSDNYTAKITFSNVKTYKKLDEDNVTIIDSEEYYSDVSVTNAKGDNLASINNGLISTKSCIAIADRNSVLEIDNISLSVYDQEKIPEEIAAYKGSQIRTTLVPFKNSEGQINEADKRQGLRFAFATLNVGDTITVDGKSYSIKAQGAIVALTHLINKGEDFTVDKTNGNIAVTYDLLDYEKGGVMYKSAYIYNIPLGSKDTNISARLFIAYEDDDGLTNYIYSDIQTDSIASMYARIPEADRNSLDDNVKAWF